MKKELIRTLVDMEISEESMDRLADFILRRESELLARVRKPLAELYAMVKGECPSLLDEDSGGNARLDMEIEEALSIIDQEGGRA